MPHSSAILMAGSMIGCLSDPLPATVAAGQPDDNSRRAVGQKQPAPAEPSQRRLGSKTLGGRQFWGDRVFWHGWRIQQNVITGHHRLIDQKDFRFASGTMDVCRAKLKDIQSEPASKPMTGTVVVLVHGLGRSSKSFSAMSRQVQQAGLTAIPFDYPSTRIKIDESVEFLHSTLMSMPNVERVHFVVHSLGGLLVRRYAQKYGGERIGRVVMLGVPNSGAKMADILRGNPLFKAVLGPAGQELISDADGLAARSSTPKFEFAVIAGGRGNAAGFNPLIPGDDDGTVGVQSTRLAGARDFAVVPRIHSFLMLDPRVMQMTVEFLKTGRLRRDQPRQPIEPPKPSQPKKPAGD